MAAVVVFEYAAYQSTVHLLGAAMIFRATHACIHSVTWFVPGTDAITVCALVVTHAVATVSQHN